jgi:hypothetical protein
MLADDGVIETLTLLEIVTVADAEAEFPAVA